MNGTIDTSRVRRVRVFFSGLANVAERMAPLMVEVRDLVVEDNRKGILEGKQGDDSPMPQTTYRGSAAKATRARSGAKRGAYFGQYKGPATVLNGKRVAAAPGNGNLTSAEYKKLSGPPLAPRGDQSRSIANLTTQVRREGDSWVVEKAWRNVVSKKGKPFLNAHFLGKNRLPKRDLRGVRKWGRDKIAALARRWIEAEIIRGL